MKNRVRILMLGSGGKESALAWKMQQSPRLDRLYSYPASQSGAETADGISTENWDSIKSFIISHEIDIVLVCDEHLIFSGLTDFLESVPVAVIAPSQECGKLEGSKEFAKEFMSENFIPSPRFMTVTVDTIDEGREFLTSLTAPYVLKADGPAGGRGVVVCQSLADAKDALESMLAGLFGESSRTVVIEEFIKGRECSLMFACDGNEYMAFPPVKDYKRLRDGNQGPNTGGMGASSPVEFADSEFIEKVKRRILLPTFRGLAELGLSYKGFLYLGIIESEGEPLLLEYNVRLGDPETEVLMPRLKTDFIDILEAMAEKTVGSLQPEISDDACVGVVVASDSYPYASLLKEGETAPKLKEIGNLQADGCLVFPADVKEENGILLAGKNRVAVVCALDSDIQQAARKALKGAGEIEFEGKIFRTDIS